MKRKRKQRFAGILAFILLFATVFQSVPINTYAAQTDENVSAEIPGESSPSGGDAGGSTQTIVQEPEDTTVSGNFSLTGDDKTWQIKSAATHTNAHPHENGKKAFFAVCDDGSSITNEAFSVTIVCKSDDARGGFLNKYVSDTEYSFIGWDASGWFVQRNGGYQPVAGLTKPAKDDEFTVNGSWNEQGQLVINVVNKTQNKNETAVCTETVVNGLKDTAGKFGMKAGTFGGVVTDLLFRDVTVGSQYYTGEWHSLYAEEAGQVLGLYTEPAPEPKMWHIKSSDQHENGDFGSTTQLPAFFVEDSQSSITGENFSVTFLPTLETNRMGFLNKYVDENNWSYIGYNTANWYVQWAGTGINYLDIPTSEIPLPQPYDLVTMEGSWENDGLALKVTINHEGTETSYSKKITDTAFVAYKNSAGKIGFRAGSYNTANGKELTEFYVKSVTIGSNVWAGNLTSIGDAKGGVVEVAPVLPTKPVTGDGKKWYYVKGGGGGHNYQGEGGGPATAVDYDEFMPKDGKLSLTIKPDTNNNNFGIFYTFMDNSNWLYVGYDSSSKWYCQYKLDGDGSYPGLGGLPEPVAGTPMEITISISNETLMVDVNGVTANKPLDAFMKLMEKADGKGRFGVMVKGTSMQFSDVKLGTKDCMNDNWNLLVPERAGQVFETRFTSLANVSGTVTDKQTSQALEGATVRIGNQSAVTDQNGQYLIEDVEEGDYRTSASMMDYVSVSGELTIQHDETERTGVNFQLLSKSAIDLTKYQLIQSDEMKAYVAKDFPRVLRYLDMEGNMIFVGQEAEVNQVKINGTLITPVVTLKTDLTQEKLSSLLYTLVLKDAAASIDLEMDVKVTLEGKNLIWEVTRLDKKTGCANIASIEVPELNLVTMDSYGENAEFMGAKASKDTNASGDQRIHFGADGGFIPNDVSGYLYGVLSGNGYAAGLYSNSEAEGDLRVIRSNGPNAMSLTSAPWYYEMGDNNGQKYAGNYNVERYKASELPFVKVCLADDLNGDGAVDWQDGAIAYRSIVHYAQGTDVIKDTVNYRIAMNFASMSPNPYLETADNIKKVFLATDGLPQAVMLKGYGNEGHDSANSEYADIAERQGGAEDFQELIRIAHKYNTEIGIHVNAQEIYPEAASFSDTMVGKNTTGIGNGWGWLDQSHAIDKLWDLHTQARYKRLVQLYDRINGTDFYSKKWDPDNKQETAVGESTGTLNASMDQIREDAMSRADNMDFIYLDVWYQNAWETRRIAEEINSLGWRFTTEFSDQGEYDSTWQHWATDASYGGNTAKGFNSDLIRFIRNDQRDSQVLNYPQFGGTADNPLLGGYRLRGFEGWGGDYSFENYIYSTFKDNLPTRFLQHYQVTNWENYPEGESPTGNHEKAITLKNDAGDTVHVERVEAQRQDEEIERKITLNGKTVLYCAPEEFSYLLPWTDNQDNSEKLYHWNMYSTATEWELPDGWGNAGSLIMYRLTDQGRADKQTIPVVNGKISLTAEAGVPYVIVKAEGAKALESYYGEGDYVTDPGFNGYADGEALKADYWTGDLSSFVVYRGDRGDQFVQADSPEAEVKASTTIRGLTPGRDYVAEIYVDNRSDAKATLEITNGNETKSAYTLRSIAANYVQCDEQHTRGGNESYMQHILVPFNAKAETAVFTLKREAGEGVTMWDDIRIVEQRIDNYKADGSFEQDFESVVQGLYPFVLGYAQGVSDPSTHLSELHAPYTQTGWNGRVIDDVIGGKWSLKNHTKGTSGIIYQTIPQNFRFEAGRVYDVTYDYQAGVSGAYAMVTGEATEYQLPAEDAYLETSIGTDGNATVSAAMKVVGADSGQTWIGLYCNGGNGSAVMGERDFILDNLKIAEDKETVIIYGMEGKTSLLTGESVLLKATNTENAQWRSGDEAVVTVDSVGRVKAIGKGSTDVTVTNEAGRSASVTFTVEDGRLKEVKPADAVGNTEEPDAGGEAVNAVDGDKDSLWHSQWSASRFTVNADNPAIITVDFGEPVKLSGFYFLNRGSGENGIVQKYQWAAGNEFDAAAHTITDAELSSVLEGANQTPGGREEVTFDQSKEAQYLQIVVSQGKGDFAAIAEIGGLVYEKVATGVKFEQTELEMTEGDMTTLKAIATEGDIFVEPEWSSSDVKVATVGVDGVVKALKPGSVKITFTTGNGLKAECNITVNRKKLDAQTPEDMINGAADKLEEIMNNSNLTQAEKEKAVQGVLDDIWTKDLTSMEINGETIGSLELAEEIIAAILGVDPEDVLQQEDGLSGFSTKFALLSVEAGKMPKLVVRKALVPELTLDGNKELANASSYEIKLELDGSPITPKAPILVRIPLTPGMDLSKLVILHIGDDGVVTVMKPHTITEEYIDIIVGSFSTFVVAETAEKNPGGGDNPGGNDNNGGSNPGGNDNNGGGSNSGGNDNNGGAGSDKKPSADSGSVKSPKTYDGSLSAPDKGAADEAAVAEGAEGAQAAAAVGAAADRGSFGYIWVVIAAMAVALLAAFTVYRYKSKEDEN